MIERQRERECVCVGGGVKSLCFNWAPRHEGVLWAWRYSSTHSWPWH